MKTVVITGSTRGIGFGMARESLRRGNHVVVSGRSPESTDGAAEALVEEYGDQLVMGRSCQVSRYEQVEELWDAAVGRFGEVDVWINNAGLGNPGLDFWEQSLERIEDLVHTNLLGVMYGSKVAMRGMLEQGHGQIYNMEGLGSNGMVLPGAVLYGTTKSAVTYLTRGLVKEARKTPVKVGFLSPGIVATDLISEEDLERSGRILRILADRVETVTPYLVERILANDRHGARIDWLPRRKIAWRFATAPFNRRDPFLKNVRKP